jgi:hypothetical protein
MENLSDIMLSHWWIVKHGALSRVTEEDDMLQFMSKHCHQHCTEAAVYSVVIEYDDLLPSCFHLSNYISLKYIPQVLISTVVLILVNTLMRICKE